MLFCGLVLRDWRAAAAYAPGEQAVLGMHGTERWESRHARRPSVSPACPLPWSSMQALFLPSSVQRPTCRGTSKGPVQCQGTGSPAPSACPTLRDKVPSPFRPRPLVRKTGPPWFPSSDKALNEHDGGRPVNPRLPPPVASPAPTGLTFSTAAPRPWYHLRRPALQRPASESLPASPAACAAPATCMADGGAGRGQRPDERGRAKAVASRRASPGSARKGNGNSGSAVLHHALLDALGQGFGSGLIVLLLAGVSGSLLLLVGGRGAGALGQGLESQGNAQPA